MFDEKKQVQIQEERGLWKASSFVHKIADRLARKNLPLSVRYLLEAHRMIFSETNEKDAAGKYRRSDPFIKRIDGTKLIIPHWSEVPNQMAILEEELKNKTSQISPPKTTKDYARIIDIAVKTSHRLVCIHPFHNGNGRVSRLLINFVLFRAGLPSIAIKEDKEKYLKAMLQADKGDFDLLRRLIIRGLISAQSKKIDKQRGLLIPRGKQKRLVLRKRDFK